MAGGTKVDFNCNPIECMNINDLLAPALSQRTVPRHHIDTSLMQLMFILFDQVIDHPLKITETAMKKLKCLSFDLQNWGEQKCGRWNKGRFQL